LLKNLNCIEDIKDAMLTKLGHCSQACYWSWVTWRYQHAWVRWGKRRAPRSVHPTWSGFSTLFFFWSKFMDHQPSFRTAPQTPFTSYPSGPMLISRCSAIFVGVYAYLTITTEIPEAN